MTKLAASKVRQDFDGMLDRVERRRERVAIERKGKTVAVIVPVEDLELLERLEDEIDTREARKALAEPGDNVPFERVLEEAGLDLE